MGQLNLTGIILGCVRARTPSEVEHIAQFISETISKIPYSLLAFSPRFDTRKNGETYLMEVKHHYNYHTLTGLDESRILRAVFEDVTEGFKLGLNRLKVDKSMIVVNTKFSEHARRYARCRQIHLVGQSSPPNQSLRTMIEEKKLYPLTCLQGLDAAAKERLASAGILLLKQLAAGNPEKLVRETKIPKGTLESMIKKARVIVSEEG